MRLFLILSLVVFTSCGTTYKVADIQEKQEKIQEFPNPYFNQIGKEYSFRFKITFMKNEMKGNFVVKKMDENSHRVVMMSDFGNTLFDLSINQSSYTLNYAMPDLNKKMIVKTLADDLQSIFESNFQLKEVLKTTDETIIKSKDVSLVFDHNDSIYFKELVHLKNNKIKTINQFDSDKTDYPDKIFIKHNHFNLSIALSKSNTQSTEE